MMDTCKHPKKSSWSESVMISKTSKNHDFPIKNDIMLSTRSCVHLGHVQTDLNETWCHGSLMIDLWADRLWSGELGFNLRKCVKPVSVTLCFGGCWFSTFGCYGECFAPLKNDKGQCFAIKFIICQRFLHHCAPAQRIWWTWGGKWVTADVKSSFFHDFRDARFWGRMFNNIDN